MMKYFHKKTEHQTKEADIVEEPVLTEEDEAFLQRITSESDEKPPLLPTRPQDLSVAGDSHANNAQLVLHDDPQDIPLPEGTDSPRGIMTPSDEGVSGKTVEKGKGKGKIMEEGKKMWSFLRRDSRDRKLSAATTLDEAAKNLKAKNSTQDGTDLVPHHEAQKEEDEMSTVLEQLNLAAVNNRVFSISKESQELLRKFTLVLKDLVNGVPTAYDDLESLLKNSENQLQNSYKHLPSFLQKLVEQLPEKFTASLAPEMLAAAAEKPVLKSGFMSASAGVASKLGIKTKIPNLKDLVTKPGAVIGMLKAIMNFLKLRFPAFLGMNVLWSLALFILLFVFWYCYKRGRETRLEKERVLIEAETAAIEARVAADSPGALSAHPSTTTAPVGVSIQTVQNGMTHSNPEDPTLRSSETPAAHAADKTLTQGTKDNHGAGEATRAAETQAG